MDSLVGTYYHVISELIGDYIIVHDGSHLIEVSGSRPELNQREVVITFKNNQLISIGVMEEIPSIIV